MQLTIEADDLTRPEVRALIRHHLTEMHEFSPPESVHALDLDGLRGPNITFWSAWEGGRIAGIGALKELDPSHGEVKSMRTAPDYLRKGVARLLLERIIETARERGYRRLSLETGSMAQFEPARSLYLRYGFENTVPFADYAEDPNSVFMTLEL
ncbi:GNAT family N-acetyltransferase [Cohnella zeiphila]|uniref:GNAT family N-acetyltransferase n=1 Tax=Cohnella zeiphila TaxID=2761120 RepID=A0A7X0SPP8_9BACL|nr:GNAT family N-acetyltransferase [Cohnella zeiphila]MBB6733892.1 GNAT family N-acetyltransferase [Cohnella zeiphila]